MNAWPLRARIPSAAANVNQKITAIASRPTRVSTRNAPPTITSSTITSAGESGPHQNWSGSTRLEPRITNASTSAKFDGLKMCLPRNWIRYFDAIATAPTRE